MEKQELTVLKIEDLRPFPGNPFHLVEDEQLMELSENIKEFGMAAPILTRPAEGGNGYEVISGQRRVRAAELAEVESVPAFVLPIDRDRAIITLVDSNIQRENILPSERAFAYKMKLDAMKRQGYRTDLTLSQVGTKSRTDEIVAKGFGVSKSTVQRFIRLTELLPPILQMVDEGRIALTPGAELSFLTQEEQENLLTTMESEDATPSLAQAQRMKKLSQAGQLDMFFWTHQYLAAYALALVVFLPGHKLVKILCGRKIKNLNKPNYDWQRRYDVVILNVDKIDR